MGYREREANKGSQVGKDREREREREKRVRERGEKYGIEWKSGK